MAGRRDDAARVTLTRNVTLLTWRHADIASRACLFWCVPLLTTGALRARRLERPRRSLLPMVYLPPPQFETPASRGYERAYNAILATHRNSPLMSAESLIMLVAPDVDALCAARMLEDLLKQDAVMHKIRPVSGVTELEQIRDELLLNTEVSKDLQSLLYGTSLTFHSASYAYTRQPWRDSRSSFTRVVWRVSTSFANTCHRLESTAELSFSIWAGREGRHMG